MDIKGVKVGLLGTYVLREGLGIKDSMIANLESLKEQGAQIIIASFHWGSEKAYEPDSTQIELAHAAIGFSPGASSSCAGGNRGISG